MLVSILSESSLSVQGSTLSRVLQRQDMCQRTTVGGGTLLPFGSRVYNSRCQTWWQMPSPAVPSRWPRRFL